MNPVEASNSGRGLPGGASLRGSLQGLNQVRGDSWFRLLLHGHDLKVSNVTKFCARIFEQLLIDLQPVAFLTVRFEQSLEPLAVNCPIDRCSTTPRQLCTCFFGQNHEGP